MKLSPPAPFNSVTGLVWLAVIAAGFAFAYNKSAKLRTTLGGKA